MEIFSLSASLPASVQLAATDAVSTSTLFFTHAGKQTAEILWWWNWLYSRPWKRNGQPKVTRRNFKFGVWIYVYKSSSTHSTCVKVTARVFKKTALYWTPALCLGGTLRKMKARVICKHKLIWRVNLVNMAVVCLWHNLPVVDAAACAQSWLDSAAVQMVQVILFGLLSVPAVGWVVGWLLSEGSPLDPLDLIWTLQAQHSRMMCVRTGFSVQLMQRWPGWREEECEERERGRRRSEGETVRRRERVQWQSERKETLKLYLLVVWLSSVVKGLCVCSVQSEQSFCLRHACGLVAWVTDSSSSADAMKRASSQISRYLRTGAWRRSGPMLMTQRKAATVLAVYPVHCSTWQWEDTWL